MKIYFIICLVILGCLPPSILWGSQNKETSTQYIEENQFNRALEKLQKDKATENSIPLSANRGLPFTFSEEMQVELGRILYKDYKASLNHNQKIFEWQLCSSRIIFWVVIGLVITGIIFSGIQFFKALKSPQQQKEKECQEELTELEISTRGIKVSSPVLGVIILVISLGFFYLFLIHVYPVQHVQKKTSHISAGKSFN